MPRVFLLLLDVYYYVNITMTYGVVLCQFSQNRIDKRNNESIAGVFTLPYKLTRDMFIGRQVSVLVSRDGRVRHVVRGVCQVIMAGIVEKSAPVRTVPPVTMCQESVNVNMDGEESAVTNVS